MGGGGLRKPHGIKCRLDLTEEELALDSDRATAIYRILQELLTNVARHAAATEVEVQLEKQNHDVVLKVRDNGKGMAREKLAGPGVTRHPGNARAGPGVWRGTGLRQWAGDGNDRAGEDSGSENGVLNRIRREQLSAVVIELSTGSLGGRATLLGKVTEDFQRRSRIRVIRTDLERGLEFHFRPL